MPSPVGDVCQDTLFILYEKTANFAITIEIPPKTSMNKKGMLCGSRKYGYSTLYESSLLHGFQSRVHPPDHFIKLLRFAEI